MFQGYGRRLFKKFKKNFKTQKKKHSKFEPIKEIKGEN